MSSLARRVASGSLLRVLNFVLTAFVSVLLMPFIIRTLGDRMYGFWALVATFIGYYGLLDFGLTSAVCQHIATSVGRGDHNECNRVFATALRIQAGMGFTALLLSLILAGASRLVCHNPDDAALFTKVVIVMGLNMALAFPLRAFAGVMAANLRYDLIAGLDLLSLLLRNGFIVFILLMKGGVLGMAWATALATVPSAVLQVAITKRKWPWLRFGVAAKQTQTTRSLFRYSVYTFAAQTADRLRFQADPFVITAFVGLSALTHYKIASLLAEQFVQLMIAAMSVFQPVFSRLQGAFDRAGTQTAFFFATKLSICLSTFVAFGLIAWGRPFIARWMGPAYENAYGPLVALTVASTLALWQTPSVDLLYATAKHKFYAYANWIEGALNLGCSLLLVRHFGMLGVALGTLIAMGIMRLLVQPLWMSHAAQIPYRTYMQLLVRTAAQCCGLCLVMLPACKWGFRPHYGYLFASAAGASLAYLAGVLLIVFTQTERKRILSILLPNRKAAVTVVLTEPAIVR